MFTDLIEADQAGGVLSPQEQKWIAEAQADGRVKWLSRARMHYGLYRFIGCGHEQEIDTGSVRRGELRCQTCLKHKYQDEATANGRVEWLRQTRGGRGLYRGIECGHEQESDNSDVRKGRFRCQTCLTHKYQDEAAAGGRVEWLRQTKKNHGLYRFIECGHEQEIANSNVRNGEFRCATCQKQKHQEEATANGRVEWLRQTRVNYGLYRFIECGHEQEIDNGAVRKGQFACQVCETTWVNTPSNLYLHQIRYGDIQLLKFGRAQSVEQRIKGYGLPDGATIRTLQTWPLPRGMQADRIETLIGRIVPNLDRALARQVLTASGSTECFDVKHAALLIDLADAFQLIHVPEDQD